MFLFFLSFLKKNGFGMVFYDILLNLIRLKDNEKKLKNDEKE